MRAQIAAYRRTLQMTFAASHSMSDAAGASGLTWLETPDQSLVWGIALGLRAEIEALLSRAAEASPDGPASTSAYQPAWYTPASTSAYQPAWYTPAAGRPAPGPAAMFSAIEAIGSQSAPPDQSAGAHPAGS
jgi:hypothetical protein